MSNKDEQQVDSLATEPLKSYSSGRNDNNYGHTEATPEYLAKKQNQADSKDSEAGQDSEVKKLADEAVEIAQDDLVAQVEQFTFDEEPPITSSKKETSSKIAEFGCINTADIPALNYKRAAP